jgi:hypothetical protein
VIQKWLDAAETVKNPLTLQQEEMSQLDLITLAQIKKARSGDTMAFNSLLDRIIGRPVQEIQNTGKDGVALPAPKVTIIENH